MASLYQNNKVWYVSVYIDGKRATKSLKTEDIKVAKKLKPYAEYKLIAELMGFEKPNQNLTFPQLVKKYLTTVRRSKNTQLIYSNVLKKHLAGKPLPTNPNSRGIHIRTINACWNWGLKNDLVKEAKKLPIDTRGEPRQRTYSDHELKLMFQGIEPISFNRFVRFAYYTGARRGEICSISDKNIIDGSLIVNGKTGRRMIKLNSQALAIIIDQGQLWNYKGDFVTHRFKKEVRRLGIKNARFHDLRRTFGLNLIKQGISIYKVSKLLGHRSVRTTELHYAPLLTTEIEDFKL